MRESQDM